MTKHFHRIFLPGSTIGMVGGGQLGRMFAIAATQMGYRVAVFCEHRTEPAAQIAHKCFVGKLDDMHAVDAFATYSDVITLEFENIPAPTIARCEQFAPTYPSAYVLATAQDRLREKQTLSEAGLPVAKFAHVTDKVTLAEAVLDVGLPLILKTVRSGYDGKGQHRIESLDDVEAIDWSLCDDWVAEEFVPFACEVSVIVARRADGETKTFPLFENAHANHILDVTTVPARVSEETQRVALEIATRAAAALDVVGLLCVEMFVRRSSSGSETVLINEVAPRPHNSGHLSIEACVTSQFEQHVRAVCGLPLGETKLICGGAAMANILGDCWGDDGEAPNWSAALGVEGVRLHLYGKENAKRGRKMGHITCAAKDRDEAESRVRMARERICSRAIE